MTEEKYVVYSSLFETQMFEGTKKQCEDYRKEHSSYDSLYIVKA